MSLETVRTSAASAEGSGRTLIRWSAVLAGTALGLAALVLLTSLWLALANASAIEFIQRNMEWFVGVSAVVCLFLAGVLAGYLSGVHGSWTGFLHGATIWALLLIVSMLVGIPAILNVFSVGQLASDVTTPAGTLDPTAADALWSSFWTILGGFLAAGIGGMIGGLLTRDDIVRVEGEQIVRRDREVGDRKTVDDRTTV